MDYKEKREFVKFLLGEVKKQGIKYFEGDGYKVIGSGADVDTNAFLDVDDSESYVGFKKPKSVLRVDAVDPFQLRPEEKKRLGAKE